MSIHTHTIRVRYAESDQMGVAHHASYIPWLEEARIEWLRARGSSYRALEAGGVLLPVIDLRIRYKKPLRFDDLATLVTSARLDGPSRLTFLTVIRLDDAVCAEAEVALATVNPQGRPIRLPAALVERLGASAPAAGDPGIS